MEYKRRGQEEGNEIVEKIININRVAKVVKGGRRFSFSALVAVGDMNGSIGVAMGKANEVPEAIRKAIEKAKKSMITVPLVGATISHDIIGHYGAGRVFLKPASKGTGIIAGGPVRLILTVLGVKDVLTKCLGTSNPHNVIRATLDGLKRLRSVESVAKLRNINVEELRSEVSGGKKR